MMKIGIYIEEKNPQEGGASVLLDTIKAELNTSFDDFDFVILYRGGFFQKYKTKEDGIKYINIEAGKVRFYIKLLVELIIDSVNNILRKLLFFNEKHKCISYLDKIARKEEIDFIWFTFPILEKITVPYAFTIWDLGHRMLPMFPEVNDNWEMRERLVSSMVYHASYIITGNNQGKREILNNYNIEPKKIVVAPFPVSSFCFGKQKKPEFDLPEKYFFYPAQFWPHKNHIIILKSICILKDLYHIDCPVVFTGSDKGYLEIIKDTSVKLNIEDLIIYPGFVTFEEMKYLYVHATAMVYPSFMGPNNLPPIEAAYLGCPVILSDLPGHREQMQDAALYFDPMNPYELAEQMKRIFVNDENVVDGLRDKMHHLDITEKYINSIVNIFKNFEILSTSWKGL